MKRAFIFTAICFFWSSPLQAKEDCENPITQTAMNICSYEEYKKADEALNTIYQKALEHLGKEEKESFRENQRAWITYRDLTCAFETRGKESGGTIWPLIGNSCMTRLTKQRTEEIPYIFLDGTLQ